MITAGFLAATMALGALWHAIGEGVLVEHAIAVTPVILADVFLF